jgi:hypothetical protein
VPPGRRRKRSGHGRPADRTRLAETLPRVRAVEARLSAGFTAEEMTVVNAWLTRMTEAYPAKGEEIATR